MKIILDTNIVMSSIFFGGNPRKIIDLWLYGHFSLIASKEILQEYEEIFIRLNEKYKASNIHLFKSITSHIHIVSADILPKQICEDPDDDKFLACALSSNVDFIVTGDKLLLKVKSIGSSQILTGKEFLDLF